MAGLNRICTFLRRLATILAHYSSNCTQGNGQLYSLSNTNFLRLFSKTKSINTCISYNYVVVHKKNWPTIFILLTNRMLYISFFLLTIANYNVYVLVACYINQYKHVMSCMYQLNYNLHHTCIRLKVGLN